MLLVIIIVAVLVSLQLQQLTESSHFLVKTLPGFDGDLPFTLETGNPKDDPLMLWLTGGPGCTGLNVLMYEIGPFTFNLENSTLEKPVLEINPHSWTKAASIIFVDQPAGTGFSYAKTSEAYITNDTSSATGVYNFLNKWLVEHPKFLKNPFYLGADSYGGIFLPMVAKKIFKGNEVGEGLQINIKGYVLGNPLTDTSLDVNSRIPFAHSKALLSDEIYKSAKENCGGEYLSVDPNNTLCVHDLKVVEKCLGRICRGQILDPYCDTSDTIKSGFFKRDLRAIDETSIDIPRLPRDKKHQWCHEDNYIYQPAWANTKDVREALHIPMELDNIEWVQCNTSLKYYFEEQPAISYTHDVWSVVEYHRRLSGKNCRALIYSGDHDMIIPHGGTVNWIESLNIPVIDDWRPWFVDQQVAGYTKKYSKDVYNLTFATIKGGGHTAAEYNPKECQVMFLRWIANEAL